MKASSISTPATPPRMGAVTVLQRLIGMVEPSVTASLITAAIVYASGLSRISSPAVWIAIAPLIYFLWMFALLFHFYLSARVLAALAPKPRKVTGTIDNKEDRSKLFAVGVFYSRWAMFSKIPFLNAHMMGIPWLQRLAMGAYSGNVVVKRPKLLSEFPLDPDLTYIEDGVTIGQGAILTAHAFVSNPDGTFTYATAPIKVGRFATVGAGSRVEMGCDIGPGAIILPGSMLSAYTVVAENEIWGGSPAAFVRMRPGAEAEKGQPERRESATSIQNGHTNGHISYAGGLTKQILAQAFDLHEVDPAEQVWDSIDQMSVASAIYGRTGLSLDPDQIFSLRSIADIQAIVSASNETIDEDTLVLPQNPELLPLLDHRSSTRALLAELVKKEATSQSGNAYPVCIASSFTDNMLQQPLQAWTVPFGTTVEVQFAGFNQIATELTNPASLFAQNEGGMNVVLQTAYDLPEQAPLEFVSQMLELIKSFVNNNGSRSRICVGTMPSRVNASNSLSDKHQQEQADARSLWNDQIGEIAGVEVLPFSEVIEEFGTNEAFDERLCHKISCPFSEAALQEVAIAIARKVRMAKKSRAKVIVVDCDNTLWGGVIGELGVEGIQLGESQPGRYFQELQAWLLERKQEGVLLCIASRNEESDVWNAFDNHPHMLLSRADIIGHRINWLPKSENLISLAEELNLGLDSFVFLDDDPAVRLEVETRCPDVVVVPLESPETYVSQVSQLWSFDSIQITDEDKKRTEMMRAEQDRNAIVKSSVNYEEFLANLNLTVRVCHADIDSLPRFVQLIQKTNQFNLSVQRRSLEEVQALGDEARLLTVSATDRFGEYGTVGAAILLYPSDRPDTVVMDTFLLSCRALGRHVEHAFFSAILDVARTDEQRQTLLAPVAHTVRNQPARDFCRDAGFTEVNEGLLSFDLNTPYDVPSQIELIVESEAETKRPHLTPTTVSSSE